VLTLSELRNQHVTDATKLYPEWYSFSKKSSKKFNRWGHEEHSTSAATTVKKPKNPTDSSFSTTNRDAYQAIQTERNVIYIKQLDHYRIQQALQKAQEGFEDTCGVWKCKLDFTDGFSS
jgi:hypothetical protein